MHTFYYNSKRHAGQLRTHIDSDYEPIRDLRDDIVHLIRIELPHRDV